MWRSMVMIRAGSIEIRVICPPLAHRFHPKIYNNWGYQIKFLFSVAFIRAAVVLAAACCRLEDICVIMKIQGGMTMELKAVKIDKPDEMNFILGQSHFIKTVEDIHEAMVT